MHAVLFPLQGRIQDLNDEGRSIFQEKLHTCMYVPDGSVACCPGNLKIQIEIVHSRVYFRPNIMNKDIYVVFRKQNSGLATPPPPPLPSGPPLTNNMFV